MIDLQTIKIEASERISANEYKVTVSNARAFKRDFTLKRYVSGWEVRIDLIDVETNHPYFGNCRLKDVEGLEGFWDRAIAAAMDLKDYRMDKDRKEICSFFNATA